MKSIRRFGEFKKKSSSAKMQHASIRTFVRSKRALSPVMSNLILIAVVIVLGFAALAYARDMSDDFQSSYHSSVSSDIERLKESIAFENVFYNSTNGNLHVYFINAGRNDLTISQVYLSTSQTPLTFSIKLLNGTTVQNNDLSIGSERQIVISQSLSTGTYTVRLTTSRGSNFAYNFAI